jgi:hypothetical protein
MATLDNSDFTEIKRIVNSDASMKAQLKGWGLDRPTWQAALQAIEDWFVSAFNVSAPSTTIKAEIETETGACTTAQANQLTRAWIRWRDKQ